MTSISQWRHRVFGRGGGGGGGGGVSSWFRVVFLLIWWLPDQQDSCLLALMRLSREADNSALVVVRETLSLANSSNTFFSLVSAVARESKYLLRSVANLAGPFA